MSQSSDEEDATSRKRRKIEETEETLMHRETPEISSKATPIEDDEVILKNIKTEDRLEDVFQDETIKAFTLIVDFRNFARSKSGLCLEQYDLQRIEDDEQKVEEQKMRMLNRWREINGPKATAMKIRFLVESFRNHLDPNSKDFIKLSNGAFVMYVKKTLGDGNNVFLGEQTSEVEGCSHPCVIKLTIYNKVSLREAKALTKLRNHENVVSILRAGEYRSIPYNYIYIAMDLAWTGRLRDVLEKCKQLNSFDQIINLYRPLDLILQVLKGLVHIHDHCIIHRDLKPENVLVSENYKNIKLNDFGICKQIEDGCTTKQTNQDVGTEGYRSPETYNNVSKISFSSDVYSVGVMIAEMISNGRHPFGNNPDLWKHNIKQKMRPDLSHLCISQMEKLLKQMMHPNPKERPTAQEVLNNAALERAQLEYPLSFGSPKEQSTTQKATPIKEDEIEDENPNFKAEDSDHLEHVFRTEVVKAFARIVDFKKFACSRHGLVLDENEIKKIEDNQGSSHEQKIQMLKKWRQNNSLSDTAMNIRSIIKEFKNSEKDLERLVGVFQDEVVNAFARIVDFKEFARSGHGLCLYEYEIKNIIEDNQSSIHEQKIQILMKWKQNNGTSATVFNIRSIIKRFKHQVSEKDSERLIDVFEEEIVNAFVKMAEFNKFARSGRGLCLDEIEIENIIEDNQRSVHEKKIQILLKWAENNDKSATATNIRSIIKSFKDQLSEKDYVELSPEYIIYTDEPLWRELHVYCGEQRSDVTGPRKVAIKLNSLNRKSKRELDHLLKLSDHPNVLRYIHSGIYNGPLSQQIYLVTELCRRENLGMLMEANKTLGIHFSESQKKAIAV